MSKFKVGDWVQFVDADGTRYFGKCTGIRDTYHSDYGDITVVDTDWTDVGYFIQDIEYWHPKEGEWCWFLVKCINYPHLKDWVLGKYLRDNLCEVPIRKTNGTYFYGCEPFIGELPSFLKDN